MQWQWTRTDLEDTMGTCVGKGKSICPRTGKPCDKNDNAPPPYRYVVIYTINTVRVCSSLNLVTLFFAVQQKNHT